ncbi:ARM repeat-containing protein [Tothia fuscella]|uniref:ARM repeat-containing protein n=1 Tax=Tothia fuscella TaxID=1048955 RepID=A0A9P4P011_9PEZI|nr:ARM repeat-containing protein [Tothia fuscella]
MAHLAERSSTRALEHVEQLILRMLQPGTPTEIHQIDNDIRQMQRSPGGWEMANFLLGRNNTHVRYFGALTFQIKINSDSENLSDEDIAMIGQQLVTWLVRLAENGEGKMVLQKLCSTLAVYYLLQKKAHADACVRTLLASFATNAPTSPKDVAQLTSDAIAQLITTLSPDRLTLALWFCRNLTEEANKKTTGHPPEVVANTLSRMKANLPDVVALLRHCLTTTAAETDTIFQLRSEALSCFLSCAIFSQPAWPSDQESLTPLRSLLEPAMVWCPIGAPESLDIFTDLLSTFGAFFQKANLEALGTLLTSRWAQEQLTNILTDANEGTGEDTPAFAKLVLAYGEVMMKELVNEPDSVVNKDLMSLMHSFFRFPGYAVIDDKLIVHAQEFWISYVEFLVDAEFEEEIPKPWLASAKSHIMQLYHEIWTKVRFPAQAVFAQEDGDTKREFRQFRADMKELLLSAFPTVGSILTETIIQACIEHLTRQEWLEVEASLFCLNAIALSEHESEDHHLASLFGSLLYVELAKAELGIPARTRQTAVDLLGQYSEFFERHEEYLPAALDFLFVSLSNPSLAQQAAKSIFRLCSSCRKSLASKLANFVQGYEQFCNSATADRTTKEKVIGGIAAIVQAIDSQEEQATWMNTLLDYIQHDAQLASQRFASELIEEGQVVALTAMACLASVGKASEAPDDVPIDVDAVRQADAWHAGPVMESIRSRIVEIIQAVMQLLANSQSQGQSLELHGDILETICNVFKTGFRETTPGPFVLSPQVTVQFFSTVQLNTPRLDIVLSMACSFLSSHSQATSPRIDSEVGALLQHLIEIIRSVADPRSEAEIASGLIEVLMKFMPRYTNVLLGVPSQADLELVFSFPLKCLTIPEYLPKRSATKFWADFLSLRGSPNATPQELLDQVLEHFGPQLAIALMVQVAGNAMRTDLDWFAAPLMILVKRHVRAKSWLEQALTSINSTSTQDSAKRMRFLKQLSVANTLFSTKKVMTAFWSQCKGLEGAYAP